MLCEKKGGFEGRCWLPSLPLFPTVLSAISKTGIIIWYTSNSPSTCLGLNFSNLVKSYDEFGQMV